MTTGSPATPEAPRTVGIVGLGAMGGAFARLLLERGFAVVGHDPDSERAAALRDRGGSTVDSPATVSERAELVLTSLPTAEAFDAVIAGADGLVAAAPGGAAVVIETSTLALSQKVWARDLLAEAGVTLLDCPVSGTGDQAAVGDLIVFASGEPDDVARAGDVLRAIGRGYHMVGEFGAGTRVKLVANQLVAIHTVGAAEALQMLEATGVDLGAAHTALCDGAATSRMLEIRGERMLERSFHGGRTRLEILVKDLELIAAAIADRGAEAPLFAHSRAMLRRAAEAGHRDADPAVVIEFVAERSGPDPPPDRST